MSKKSHKPNLPQETLERARRELARSGDMPQPIQQHVAQPTNGTGIVPEKKVVSRPAGGLNLAQEYAYVVADLEQMALLAAGIMVVLVILSLFI